MNINFDIFFKFIAAALLLSAAWNYFLVKNSTNSKNIAKKIALFGNISALLLTGLFIFLNIFYALENDELLRKILVILLILCAQLLSIIFTPTNTSCPRSYSFISLIGLSSIIIFTTLTHFAFYTILSAVLLMIFFALPKNSATRKIMLLYTLLAELFIIAAMFLHINNPTIFYIASLIFLGLFPFQSWYVKFFETASFGVITAFASFQAIAILVAVSLLKLDDLAIPQWVLAVVILSSSILALIQQQARRSLAYLINSQLGFLLFANIANSASLNLGNIFMTLSFLGASTGFIMMISALEMRKRDISLFRPNGCYESYPKLACWILVFGLISSGLPLSINYIAEDLIFEHSFLNEPFADIICLIAIAINTIIVVKMFLFLCQGTAEKEKEIDLRKHEITAVSFIFITILLTTFLLI